MRAKMAFSTRRVPRASLATLISGRVRPRPGDVVLARVARIGHHAKLELTNGRRSAMHIGDEIIVAYGDRYAPDQFEAIVPPNLTKAHLVAGGGIASWMRHRTAGVRRPTEIVPIGLVGDAEGRPFNLRDFALGPLPYRSLRPRAVAVVGTSMNAGKTTAVQHMIKGLSRAGYRPGGTKITGTGAGGDFWSMLDAGAHHVLDFTDGGLASTYRVNIETLERVARDLVAHLTISGCDTIVIEVADGLFQRETAQLIESEVFRKLIDGVVFAAGDAMGAVGGVELLRRLDLPVMAVAGRITRSPLAVAEAARATDLPVLGLDELSNPSTASMLLGVAPPSTTEDSHGDLALFIDDDFGEGESFAAVDVDLTAEHVAVSQDGDAARRLA